MHDKNILKISLAITFAGIFILYLISDLSDIPMTPLSQIGGLPSESYVKVRGIVKSVNNYNNSAFIDIAEDKTVDTTLFLFKDRNITLKRGDVIEAEGSIEEYKGRKEIVTNRIYLR